MKYFNLKLISTYIVLTLLLLVSNILTAQVDEKSNENSTVKALADSLETIVELSDTLKNFPVDSTSQIMAKVTLRNGDLITGVFIQIDSLNTILRADNEEILLSTYDIRSISFSRLKLDKELSNLNYANYLIAPSAIPFEKKRISYRNFILTTSLVDYAITDNLSVTGGFELTTFFNEAPLHTISTKYGFKVRDKNLHLAGGLTYVSDTEETQLVLASLLATFGNKERNVTLSINQPLIQRNSKRVPVFNYSGIYKLRSSFSLLIENYLYPSLETEIISANFGGFRYMTKNGSVDFGVIFIDGVLVFPGFGFFRKF